MELMIVIVIIGTLIAIIYPQYNQYILKSKRVEAQATLQELSQKLSIYRVTAGNFKNIDFNSSYGNSIPASVKTNYNFVITDEEGLAFSDAKAKLSTWKITAKAINKDLGDLTLDSQGQKCWYKETGVCFSWDGK